MADAPYLDPTAIVDPSARIGSGSRIWNWTKIREGAHIGVNCSVGQCAYIDKNVVIGDECKIQNGVSIFDGITLGDRVFIGPNATFINDRIPRAHSPGWEIAPTRIETGASVGANATILCGVTLGAYAMVAAGAMVTRDVPPHGLVMGNPARLVDYVTRTGRRLRHDMRLPPPDPAALDDMAGEVGQ